MLLPAGPGGGPFLLMKTRARGRGRNRRIKSGAVAEFGDLSIQPFFGGRDSALRSSSLGQARPLRPRLVVSEFLTTRRGGTPLAAKSRDNNCKFTAEQFPEPTFVGFPYASMRIRMSSRTQLFESEGHPCSGTLIAWETSCAIFGSVLDCGPQS